MTKRFSSFALFQQLQNQHHRDQCACVGMTNFFPNFEKQMSLPSKVTEDNIIIV